MLTGFIRDTLIACRLISRPELIGKPVDDFPAPETLRAGQLHIVMDGKRAKWACTPCPCGCGQRLQLSLNSQRRPRWTVVLDWLGRPTVNPSIRQQGGCLAHFWIRNGKVDWCKDSGEAA